MKRTALFAGSFDPYTNGHHSLVRKAAGLFDEVVILIGVNVRKSRHTDADAMKAAIEQTLRDDGLANVSVVTYTGMIADYCAEHDIHWYVRGIRNHLDYNYEENIAEVNKLINPAMESVYFRSDNVAVSSSMVKELHSFGLDVSPYLPKAVYDILQSE